MNEGTEKGSKRYRFANAHVQRHVRDGDLFLFALRLPPLRSSLTHAAEVVRRRGVRQDASKCSSSLTSSFAAPVKFAETRIAEKKKKEERLYVA